MFKNKVDEHGTIARNKVKLVAKGCNQEECLDCEGTFALIVRLELKKNVISLCLSY